MSRFTPHFQGIIFMLTALAFFSILDTTAKYLMTDLPPLQVVAFRYLVACVLIIFYLQPWKNREVLTSKKPVMQILRSIVLLFSTAINFIALQYLQLDQTMAIIFTTPFIVAILAGPMLGEWIGKYRIIAICVGFIGVLIITNPFSKSLHWAMLFSFSGAFLYAYYNISTRILSKFDSTEVTLFHSHIWSTTIVVLGTFPLWVMPTRVSTYFLLLLLGTVGAIGHLFMIKAHRLTPASTLSPFIYLQMPIMIGLGFFVFGQLPALNTLIGSSIIIASGLYMLYRERVRPITNAP